MTILLKLATTALLLLVGPEGSARSPGREQPTVPHSPSIALSGRVTDAARILTAKQEARLSARLERLERATGHQIVVVTVATLGGEKIDGFTTSLANRWGIGRRGDDDGIVLLVAPAERQARIAVGTGLETRLTDADCEQIMERKMIPRFRKGDVSGGIEAGVAALSARLR